MVARGWGKPCICGCSDLKFNEDGTVSVNSNGNTVVLKEGDVISLNGDTGEVLLGSVPLRPPATYDSDDIKTFMGWVDEVKSVRVLANADSPEDAREARRNGAQGT